MRTPRLWRARRRNAALQARQCDGCGFVSFPEDNRLCKRCGNRDAWTEVTLDSRGEVRTYVVQRTLPDEFETPLPFAIVDVSVDGGGPDDTARVYGIMTETDPDDLDIGTRVVAEYRRVFDLEELPVHAFKFTIPRGER